MNNNFSQNWKSMLPKFLGDDFFSSFDNLSNENSVVRMNMYETSNELLCVFTLPGLKLEEVDIYAYERTLEVRGTLHTDFSGFRIIQEEIPQGPFKRTIELPFPIRDDKIDAAYQKGLLVIHLHRLIRSNHLKNKVSIKNLDDE
ncbi:Hsp20/alpha crystallin family protein [Bacillus sp. FJAT-45350]|uniref:Hsp20/alpha crystallin family protein n=1 Tax=Bacillus sp. FJAT-45350 TaxID=2011014 RepID=UPI000BB6B01E|nr:Hsp20/alpha crystallin family protein [Bacillus sp. FJAT-45350]